MEAAILDFITLNKKAKKGKIINTRQAGELSACIVEPHSTLMTFERNRMAKLRGVFGAQ